MPDVDSEPFERLVRSLNDDLKKCQARLTEVEGERDALRADDEELGAEIDRIESINGRLAAENARLRQQVNEARKDADLARFALTLGGGGIDPNGYYGGTPGDHARRLMAVVEAAKALLAAHRRQPDDLDQYVRSWTEALSVLGRAVDALQEAPSGPLSATESAEKAEVVPDSTDGVGEQGEAQGAACGFCAMPLTQTGEDGWVDLDGARGGPNPALHWHFPAADREQIPPSSIHSEGGSGRSDMHIGRAWTGHDIEDTCPCPQEPCGLVEFGKADPSCPDHPYGRAKTIRQGHRPEDCPGGNEATPTRDLLEAIFAKPSADTNQPADPPWLAEAIEAGARARHLRDRHSDARDGAYADLGSGYCWECLSTSRVAIRAALPLITRGVRRDELQTAARTLLAEARAYAEKWAPKDEMWDRGFAAGMEAAAHTVANSIDRERAARQVTG